MKPESLEKLVWALIYVGLALAMLGLWAMGDGGEGAEFAIGLAILGGVMVTTGVVLVWVRSRMGKPPVPPNAPTKGTPR